MFPQPTASIGRDSRVERGIRAPDDVDKPFHFVSQQRAISNDSIPEWCRIFVRQHGVFILQFAIRASDR